MNTSTLPITVIIAVKNEAVNLSKCLSSVTLAEQVLVVDSGSTDGTQTIVEEFGRELLEFEYGGGHPKKRQWALETQNIRHNWVLLLDADEVVPTALWKEIQEACETGHHAAYFITKGFHFLGRRFRYGGFSHAAVLLVRKGRARFERLNEIETGGLDMEVHERLIVDGSIGRLKTHLIHEDFKGLQAYIARHNQYSTWEAGVRSLYLRGENGGNESVQPNLFGNTQERRRYLKNVVMRLPMESEIWFLYHYLIRLGFLEGVPGYVAACIRREYIRQVKFKVWELKQNSNDG